MKQERLRQLLNVDPCTGILLWRYNHQRPDRIGQRTGWLTDTGYWRVALDGSTYYASQIIWLFVHGQLVGLLDHINRDRSDDRLLNLRPATKGQNAVNSKMNSQNTSGYRGVSFCWSTSKWRADIAIDGYRKNLGRFALPEQAHAAWRTAAIAAFGEEFINDG